MKKLLPFVLLIFVILLTACGQKPPQIDIEFTRFDFGDVINGEIVEQEVAVKNVGGEDLYVSEVLTTCGCTTASIEPRVIPSGEVAALQVTFDSGAHGPYLEGEIIRRVILVTNDPDHFETTVDFVANIILPENP
jgi:hypothetical protein